MSLFPLMSERAVSNDLEGLRQMFFRTQKLVFGAILPFIVLGCVFAGPLIAVWAGSQYVQAAVVMQLLLLGAFGDSILYSSGILLYASGQVKQAAWMSLVLNAVSIGAVLLAASRYGAVGVACAIAISQLFLGGGWFTLAACRVCRGSPFALVRDALSEVAVPGALMISLTAIVVVAGKALPPLWLVLAAAAIGCTYLLVWSSRAAVPLFRRRSETVL